MAWRRDLSLALTRTLKCGERMFVPVPVVAPDGAVRLASGEMRTIQFGERPVLLVNLEGAYHAVDDTCTHEECSLGEGYLDAEDGAVECPCHGATFDVRTGAVLSLPATAPLRVYQVRAKPDGHLEIDLP